MTTNHSIKRQYNNKTRIIDTDQWCVGGGVGWELANDVDQKKGTQVKMQTEVRYSVFSVEWFIMVW